MRRYGSWICRYGQWSCIYGPYMVYMDTREIYIGVRHVDMFTDRYATAALTLDGHILMLDMNISTLNGYMNDTHM